MATELQSNIIIRQSHWDQTHQVWIISKSNESTHHSYCRKNNHMHKRSNILVAPIEIKYGSYS